MKRRAIIIARLQRQRSFDSWLAQKLGNHFCHDCVRRGTYETWFSWRSIPLRASGRVPAQTLPLGHHGYVRSFQREVILATHLRLCRFFEA